MDFIRVAHKDNKDGTREFYPSLQAIENQDLVIRGGQFVAVWDESTQLYNMNQAHLADIIDRSFARMVGDRLRSGDTIRKMRVYDNQSFTKLLGLIRNIGDMGPELDQKIIFANDKPTKADAATFKMGYSLDNAEPRAWNRILETLYEADERQKIEWAIGSILSGDAGRQIQKFYVFFGPPGSGKSTIMNIIEKLFEGHTANFSAYEMGKADAQFSLEPFAKNPLVAIDQDGDLSRIEVNKNLNSIVSHDRVLINSKGKNLYAIVPRSTLFVGSNEPVKISNRKSGLFRRLVDIQPSGRTLVEAEYHTLIAQIAFELGSIARQCRDVYDAHGPTYLSSYRSHDMMYRTNDIFNFVQDRRLILKDNVTLKQAHKMYVDWCQETETRNVYKQYQFRDLLADYFEEFHNEIMIDGERYRSYFKGLRELERFTWSGLVPKPPAQWLELTADTSLLDDVLFDMPAQLASSAGTPKKPWAEVITKMKDIDSSELHYVKVPEDMVVIDFDIKDEHGEKDLAANIEAAASWPPTYAELSQGGSGLHLHYVYGGDVSKLASVYNSGVEIKTLLGDSALRRRFRLGNRLPVATISSGLPEKEEKVLPESFVITENTLRKQILQGLNKSVHAGTKSNMDFIEMVTTEAYDAGITYDVSDMFDDILMFAMGSTNQRAYCLELANKLHLKSEAEVEAGADDNERPIAFYDTEVFPNLYLVCWMYDTDDAEVVTMINPTPAQMEELDSKLRLIGYNNRKYDAQLKYARQMGYDNAAIYELSRRMTVENDRKAGFAAAYSADYADVYDYASEKKSLKKWEIELGLKHSEIDLPWDEPCPDDRVLDVASYCADDVRATRAVHHFRVGDFNARRIIAELSGLAVINTNRQHTEKLIFGDNKDPSADLVYTDLKEMFPGYEFDPFKSGKEKSTYKGLSIGEGGLVNALPGIYTDVALLDVASMHPASIIALNLFGKYTSNFQELMDTRLLIKKGDLEGAGNMFGGRLAQFTQDKESAKMLSNALKIVINSVYGLTAASFPNRFKDPRNVDNIVAKRGALFMVDLREFIESKGFQVVHTKTDSVKIPGATDELIAEVTAFGKKYGYDFEHEATYERFCLINDAVYVARNEGTWSATGAQFQHPVVFKTLFSHEEILPADYVEVRQVQKGSMYLVSDAGARSFVGRFGAFVPVLEGRRLLRIDGEKEYAVGGTKDHLWEIDEYAFAKEWEVDMTYFQELIDAALQNINKFGSYEELIS